MFSVLKKIGHKISGSLSGKAAVLGGLGTLMAYEDIHEYLSILTDAGKGTILGFAPFMAVAQIVIQGIFTKGESFSIKSFLNALPIAIPTALVEIFILIEAVAKSSGQA